MNKNKWFLILLPLIFSGCSSLDKSCVGINWHEMGRQDSARGLSFNEVFSEKQEMCDLDPESVYTKAYRNGFQAGVREYCNFKTGYIYGFSQLEEKSDSCPPELREVFSYGYRLGGYMSKIQHLKATLENKIESIEKEIKKQEARLKYSGTSENASPLSQNTL